MIIIITVENNSAA